MCRGEEHQYVFSPKRVDRFPVNQSNAWICVAYTCITPEIGLASPKFPEHRQPPGSDLVLLSPGHSRSFDTGSGCEAPHNQNLSSDRARL